MPAFDSFTPMTLANMRQNGVRSLDVTCEGYLCHHNATLDVSGYADDLTVPAFRPRMVCTVCGSIGTADVRPNWREYPALIPAQAALKHFVTRV